jgi:hypothetical protein
LNLFSAFENSQEVVIRRTKEIIIGNIKVINELRQKRRSFVFVVMAQ